MISPSKLLKKVEIKHNYLVLRLFPSLTYLLILLMLFKFTNHLGSLLVLSVLLLVVFENLIPLIEVKLQFESRIGENNIEKVKAWVYHVKQRAVLVISVLIVLIGVVFDLSDTILQWNWKYTSIMWIVYFTFAYPISALLPPREES
ncbi:MAG: hypothetical protein ACE5R6_05340 [Candidatus Heimdallarchaeota archaeon]